MWYVVLIKSNFRMTLLLYEKEEWKKVSVYRGYRTNGCRTSEVLHYIVHKYYTILGKSSKLIACNLSLYKI